MKPLFIWAILYCLYSLITACSKPSPGREGYTITVYNYKPVDYATGVMVEVTLVNRTISGYYLVIPAWETSASVTILPGNDISSWKITSRSKHEQF